MGDENSCHTSEAGCSLDSAERACQRDFGCTRSVQRLGLIQGVQAGCGLKAISWALFEFGNMSLTSDQDTPLATVPQGNDAAQLGSLSCFIYDHRLEPVLVLL